MALALGRLRPRERPAGVMANTNFKIPRTRARTRARARFLWRLVDPKAHTRVYSYLFQCGLATIFLIAVLLLHDAVLRAAIIVAVASSAFIIFVVPDSVAATPRRVIGGHVVAIIIGTVFAAISGPHEESSYYVDIMAALSVGLSILVMVTTNTEHPPAAGTALGLVIHGWSIPAVVFVLVSVLVLSIIRIVLRHKMVNLL